MTSPYMISNQWPCRRSFQGPLSWPILTQLHLNLCSGMNSEFDCGTVGKHYVRCSRLKMTQLPNNKSEHLLDFDVHLGAGYLYYTQTSGVRMTTVVVCAHSYVQSVSGYDTVLYMASPSQCCRTISMFQPTLCCLDHRLTNHLYSLHSRGTTCLTVLWGVGFRCSQGL